MEAFVDYTKWIGSLLLTIIICSLLLFLMPEGGVKKIAKILATILIFASFLPVGNQFFSDSRDLSYKKYLSDAELSLKEAEAKYKNEILRLTREEIAKRIQVQAAEWGMETDVSVSLRIDESNQILPESVYVLHHIPVEEDTLMKLRQWIFTNYQIKPRRQSHIFK